MIVTWPIINIYDCEGHSTGSDAPRGLGRINVSLTQETPAACGGQGWEPCPGCSSVLCRSRQAGRDAGGVLTSHPLMPFISLGLSQASFKLKIDENVFLHTVSSHVNTRLYSSSALVCAWRAGRDLIDHGTWCSLPGPGQVPTAFLAGLLNHCPSRSPGA